MSAEDQDLDTILGDVVAVDSGTSARQVVTMLNQHRSAIKHLNTERAEDAAQLRRMIGDAERKLTAAQKEASAQWIPAGDASDVDRRFLNADGSLRLGSVEQRTARPDGSVQGKSIRGLLDAPVGVSRQHDDLIRAYQALAVAHRLAGRSGSAGSVWSHKLVARQWGAFTDAARNLGGKSGAWFRSVLSDPAALKRVIDGSAGKGGELIQNPTISAVRRPTDLARRIPGLIQTRQAPSTSFKAPIVTGRALAKLRGATQSDPSRFPLNNFTTSDATISVVNRTVTALLDSLWATDNGLILADPIGFVMDWLMMGDADSLEMAFLHGDTAGTHMDALATWTMGGMYAAGDLDGSDSALKFWIGLRGRAHDDSNTASAGGTFSAADHFGAIELLGNRAGGDVAMMTGLHALYTQLLPLADFTTVDVAGPRATLQTGELGRIGNTPVIISQMLPNQFDTTSGLYTGSNAGSIAVYADISAYAHYEHDAGSDDFDVSYPERGAQYIGMTRRSVLTPEVISTEKPVAVLYNL